MYIHDITQGIAFQKLKFDSLVHFYRRVIKQLERRTSLVMSNLDARYRAFQTLPPRIVALGLVCARRGGVIDKLISGDHNSALNPTSLYDDMFVDIEIARASLKATPADETDHPSGLIRNFNLGSAPRLSYIR